MWDSPLRAGLTKAALSSSDAGDQPSGKLPQYYNCGCAGHYARECKLLKAHIRDAHTAVAGSVSESDGAKELGEPIEDEGAPQEAKEQSVVDDAENVQIDSDEYVTVNVYDNDYYACNDEEEHMSTLFEHQEDRHVCM
ncbi:hypothetical protein C0993_009581 [Termitomyces sp. T159_Od127]|nr:hypothetical protein C0993_009581 [Termitomyces sp. T159_Od127]